MRAVRTTLKDIANACGYSVNTVSRALRGDERLSEATRSLIRETAGRMGYIPNTMASSLRSGRSHMIAVIVNDLHNQHYCDLINRMDRELRARNYLPPGAEGGEKDADKRQQRDHRDDEEHQQHGDSRAGAFSAFQSVAHTRHSFLKKPVSVSWMRLMTSVRTSRTIPIALPSP